MIRWIYLLLIISFLPSCYSKQVRTWVLDQEGDLTATEIAQFDSLFSSHEKKTSNEIVLVTTADYGSDKNIVEYGKNIGRKYGIGKKGIDNGVVIVFSMAQRQVRISTGYGTEKILHDGMAKEIIDSLIIPKVKQDSVFTGLWNGSVRIVSFLEKPENKIR